MRGVIRSCVGGALALLALTGCVAPEETEPGAAQWSYVDDRGQRVNTKGVPERVVAQVSSAGALKDFGVDNVVGTFGPLVQDDGRTETEAGSVDPRQVTDVTGPGYGEVKLEKLASLRPDLLVSGKYAEFEGLWHLTQQQEEEVREIVPTAGVNQSGRPLPESIAAYRDLARALGANVESERVRADEQRFRTAADRLRDLGTKLRAEKRNILAVGGTPQDFYVVVPGRNPDLDFYVRELGLPIVTPKHPDIAGGGYFEPLSWENASAYTGDILMWDTRRASMPPEQMKRNPLFANQDSVRHDRFVEWDAVAPMSYASYATIMNKLADQIEANMGKFE